MTAKHSTAFKDYPKHLTENNYQMTAKKKARGRGRPPKKASEVQTKYVCVPMTEKQFKFFSSVARVHEKRLATFIRESLLTFVTERKR